MTGIWGQLAAIQRLKQVMIRHVGFVLLLFLRLISSWSNKEGRIIQTDFCYIHTHAPQRASSPPSWSVRACHLPSGKQRGGWSFHMSLNFRHGMSSDLLRLPSRLAVVLWLLLYGSLPGLAVARSPANTTRSLPARQILILESMRPGFSDADFRRATIVQTLIDHGISRSDIRVEHLDLDVNRDIAHRNNLIKLLQHKFSDNQLALIVTDQKPAYEFLSVDGPQFHPQVPVLAIVGNDLAMPTNQRPWMRIVEQGDLQATTALAMRLLPNTRHLVIATGADDDSQSLLQSVQAGIDNKLPSPTVELTNELAYEEMLQRIGTLTKDSIVLFPDGYIRDRSGRSYISQNVAEEVGKAASVPVFGTRDLYIQHGFLGSRAVDAIATGRLAANLILDHLAGRLPLSTAGLIFSAVSRDMVDWQQLRRWEVALRRVPGNAQLVNRPLTLWQRYPVQIMSGLIVTSLVGMLIVLLTQQRQRRDVSRNYPPDGEHVQPCNSTAELEAANLRLAMLSFVDELTGLANRRRLDHLLAHECQRANRSGQPLSLIMVDVDHFKEFNDRYGHLAGDDCLKIVARLLRGICQRPADQACRFGGEEFLVILPETAHQGALKRAQILWRAIGERAISHDASATAAHVTCSIGVLTSSSPPARSPRELLTLVDTQLYQAKKSGRNVICSSDLSHPLPDQASEILSATRQSYRDDCATRYLRPGFTFQPETMIAVGTATPG